MHCSCRKLQEVIEQQSAGHEAVVAAMRTILQGLFDSQIEKVLLTFMKIGACQWALHTGNLVTGQLIVGLACLKYIRCDVPQSARDQALVQRILLAVKMVRTNVRTTGLCLVGPCLLLQASC